MKRTITKIIFIAIMLCVVMLAVNCKKDDTTTPPNNTVTDIDGNIYHTITINNKTWMVENLKTTRFRNGEHIAYVADNTQWNNTNTSAYCNYNNDASLANVYGRLYNGYAARDTRNIAPLGWHVATSLEIDDLIGYLGSPNFAGGALKEKGFVHWKSPNANATNESGFTALPGGQRTLYGEFKEITEYGYWWTKSGNSQYTGDRLRLSYISDDAINTSENLTYAFSIRCVKD